MNFMKLTLVSALIASATLAQAQNIDVEMLAVLKQQYPKTQFKSVVATAIPGIYEVIMGKNVTYVDKSGRYFMFGGRMFDMQTQTDLTESTIRELATVDFKNLPLKDALKFVKGNGKRTLIVFSDPDCPYCRNLEKNLKDLSDVTIYLFMFPLEMHQQARSTSIAVWCSADRENAWQDYMSGTKAPEPKTCDNPIDRNIALGNDIKVGGTPTLFSGDGRMLAGAPDVKVISAFLDTVPAPKIAGASVNVLAKERK
jgi:thiol:disulfide interchange protein DsbC